MHLSLMAWPVPSRKLEEGAAISKALAIGAPDVGLLY